VAVAEESLLIRRDGNELYVESTASPIRAVAVFDM